MRKSVSGDLSHDSFDVNNPTPTVQQTRLSKSPLEKRRDALFARHGCPPPGAAAQLAARIRQIQTVKRFPELLTATDMAIPGKRQLTDTLRSAVWDSMDRGYSKWGLSQEEALTLRLKKEATVEVPKDMHAADVEFSWYSFFPFPLGIRDGASIWGC